MEAGIADHVWDLAELHTSATEGNDLAQALQQAIDDCRRECASDIYFSVTGLAKEMHPAVREEVYRIGYEAIRNACAHARASRVEVELRYAQDLALSVRDDGVGIEQAVLDRGKQGHSGLDGMRERAARIGGKLTIASAPASGTEIKLVVPGGIAFQRIRPIWLGAFGRFRRL